MNFLGLGPGEIFLILILALIVFGPGKLPEIGAGIGKAIREFRRASDTITQEFTRELSLEAPPQQTRPAPEPAPSASVVEEARPAAEESLPVETPVAEESHPVPTPTMEEPQPEPISASVVTAPEESPAPKRRVRRVKAAAAEVETPAGPVPVGQEPAGAPEPVAAAVQSPNPEESAAPAKRTRRRRAAATADGQAEVEAGPEQPASAGA